MNHLSIHLLCRNCLAISGQLILFWLLAGCEKNPIPLTTDSTIKGNAFADSSGRETYHIKIKAIGPYGETPVITEKKDYRIEGLGNGTYYLEYSKDGYGTVCQYGFQLFGGDVVRAPDVTLYQFPKITTIPNFIRAYTADATSPPSPYIYIYIDLAVTNIKPADLSVMLFMSSSSRDVSWDNYEFCYPTYRGGTKNNIPYICAVCIPPFKSGTEIFVRGYPYNQLEYYYGRYDTYHGNPSFSTLNKSKPTNIVSFKMP
jgi:hypothetical protein